MADVINRGNPIAEENLDPTGRPATNMYDDWSDEMNDRADNVYGDKNKKCPDSERVRREKLREMDEVVKEDLE